MQKYISNNRWNRKGTFSGQLDGCHAKRSLYFGSVNYWLEPRRRIPAVSGVSKTSKLGSLSYLIILQARIWNSMMLPKPLSKVNAKVLAFQICCMKGPRKLLLLWRFCRHCFKNAWLISNNCSSLVSFPNSYVKLHRERLIQWLESLFQWYVESPRSCVERRGDLGLGAGMLTDLFWLVFPFLWLVENTGKVRTSSSTHAPDCKCLNIALVVWSKALDPGGWGLGQVGLENDSEVTWMHQQQQAVLRQGKRLVWTGCSHSCHGQSWLP